MLSQNLFKLLQTGHSHQNQEQVSRHLQSDLFPLVSLSSYTNEIDK
jgi:hypothetical protein